MKHLFSSRIKKHIFNIIFFSMVMNPADQLWGIISRGVANRSELQNVEDCMDAIRSELSKVTIRDWLGSNVKVNVWKLNAVRAWRDHLPGLGVKLEGGLLRDDTGNHLFLSMLRKGMVPICSDMWN